MNVVNKLGAVLLGCMLAGSAMANEPIIGTSTNGFEWRILHDRVKVSTNSYTYLGSTSTGIKDITVWVRKVVINDIEQDGLGTGDYYLGQYEIRCYGSSYGYKLLKSYKYKEYPNRGFVMVDSYEPSNSSYKEAIPETMNEALVDYVCENYYTR